VSRVHDAMRRIEQTPPPARAGGALSKLVSALIEELASDVPDDPRLETVRADLVTASRSYESGETQDLALRFYLAIRSLLHEIEHLQHVRPEQFKEAAAGTGDPLRGKIEGDSGSE
jgi:hypothetical protein